MNQFDTGGFTGPELRNSIIFDPVREVAGDVGDKLLSHIMDKVSGHENRQRALTAKAADKRRATFSAFLANLAVAAFNRLDAEKFVAVSFNRNWYVSGAAYGNLSLKSAVAFRDCLLGLKLIQAVRGVNRFDYVDERFGMLSRIRATGALLDLFSDFGLEPRHVRTPRNELIVPSEPEKGAGPEPSAITASRAILERVNDRLAAAEIALPEECWSKVREWRRHKEPADQDEKHWQFAGDLTAVSLFRSFTGSWEQGGRLYGGWWQNVPSAVRSAITIDGEVVCELDFSQLHPFLLYARLGTKPPADIYAVDQQDRELGKNTFMRLLNGNRLDLKKEGAGLTLKGISFPDYLRKFRQNVAPIAEWLGKGEGLRLQREDSDLAMEILDTLAGHGVIALPVHDSFIVKERHREQLFAAMRDCFIARFGVEPEIHG